MKILPAKIPDVLIIEPQVFQGDRGFFESYNHKAFSEKTGITANFVQDNHFFCQIFNVRSNRERRIWSKIYLVGDRSDKIG